MNTKQRTRLKSIAQNTSAILQIGKYGISENLIIQVSDALRKREIVKISVLDNCIEGAKELANPLAEKTDSEVVQVIGNKIVLYKPNRKDPVISKEIDKIK